MREERDREMFGSGMLDPSRIQGSLLLSSVAIVSALLPMMTAQQGSLRPLLCIHHGQRTILYFHFPYPLSVLVLGECRVGWSGFSSEEKKIKW